MTWEELFLDTREIRVEKLGLTLTVISDFYTAEFESKLDALDRAAMPVNSLVDLVSPCIVDWDVKDTPYSPDLLRKFGATKLNAIVGAIISASGGTPEGNETSDETSVAG